MEFYRSIPWEGVVEPRMPLPPGPFTVLPRVLFEAQQLLADRPPEELERIGSEVAGIIDNTGNPDLEAFITDQVAGRRWALAYLECPADTPEADFRQALRKLLGGPLPGDITEEHRQVLLRLKSPNLVAQLAEGMDVFDWRCGGCNWDITELVPKASEFFAILAWQMVCNSDYESSYEGGVKEWSDFMRVNGNRNLTQLPSASAVEY